MSRQHPPIELRSGTPVIPYGPGMPYATEAAVVAAFPVGTPVYDMAETVAANKLKRVAVVANLDGVDAVDFSFTLPANGNNGPWELEWLMAINGLPSSVYGPLNSMVGSNPLQHWRIQIDPAVANAVICVWRTSTSTGFASKKSLGFLDGKYYKHRVEVTSDLKGRYFVDGVQQETDADLSAWTPGTVTSFRISGSAASGTKTFTKIANMRVSRGGVLLADVPFSDGSGSVATDKSGNGYNGTITDASPTTFWSRACVPIALGG